VFDDSMVRSGPHSSVSVIELPSTGTGRASAVLGDPLRQRFGPVLGVGDLLWRAVFRASAEIVCVVDSRHCRPGDVDRLAGPLLDDPDRMLVSGSYDRPDGADPRAGDRLTEIVARPLLRRSAPALAELEQPLVYEFAARRSLLGELAFPVGAGVHLSLPFDVSRAHGRAAIDEVGLGRRHVDDRPLRELGADACSLINAMRRRAGSGDRSTIERFVRPWDDLSAIYVETAERPPSSHLDGDPGEPVTIGADGYQDIEAGPCPSSR
jgi:hypothetical protein